MKRKHQFHAMLFALLAALLITSVAGAAPKNGAVANLSVDQGSFDSSQEVLVTVNISNPTGHTVKVLKWYTPVDGVEESLFAVMLNGQPVAYTGAIYKRPAATGQDYISLKAGESITSVVNLGDYYDLSQSGQYEVFYAAAAYNLYDPKGNNFKYREVLVSEKISIEVAGRAKPVPSPTPTPTTGISYNKCTVDQQTKLVQARDQARVLLLQTQILSGSHQVRIKRTQPGLALSRPPRYTTVTSHLQRHHRCLFHNEHNI